MSKQTARCVALLAIALLISHEPASATLRRLLERQANEDSESSSEVGPTSAPSSTSTQAPSSKPPTRLFPDPPNQLGPQAAAGGGQLPGAAGLTPFVPFLQQQRPPPFLQPPGGQPQLGPPTQGQPSESFQRGLGKRLLALAGVDGANSSQVEGGGGQAGSLQGALSNGTVLEQLNRGLLSVYSGLSKAYNETVQRQVAVLQDKLRKAHENQTASAWPPMFGQPLGPQVSEVFKSLAARAGDAQASLNKAWHKLTQANETTVEQVSARIQQQQQQQPRSFFDSINGFIGDQGGFFEPPSDGLEPQAAKRDFASQMRDFWGSQVQPHIVRASGMISQAWQDIRLTMGQFNGPASLGAGSQPRARPTNASDIERGSSDLVDSILQGVSLDGPEYALLEPKVNQTATDGQPARPNNNNNNVGSKIQTQFVMMQRQLNDLWRALGNRLQSAIATAGGNNNNAFRDPFRSEESKIEQADPAENEISGKLRELGAVQRDADQVFQQVQRQKLIQEQQQQQRRLFGDDFRSFFNNIDNSVNKMGAAIGDFWHHVPDRWNNFANRMRPTTPATDQQPKPTT